MPAEGGSSYAAARVHAGVLQGLMEADARALAETVYRCLARPFAAVNFGNPDLAPRVIWDVKPYEDNLARAKTAQSVAQTLFVLREAGLSAKDAAKFFKDFGLDLGGFDSVEPLQIEAQAARAGADVAADGAAPDKATAKMRIARLMARVDPKVMAKAYGTKMRVIEDQAALSEALAEIEAETSLRKRDTGRARWVP
jgi:hypothetical protein